MTKADTEEPSHGFSHPSHAPDAPQRGLVTSMVPVSNAVLSVTRGKASCSDLRLQPDVTNRLKPQVPVRLSSVLRHPSSVNPPYLGIFLSAS